MTSNENEGMTNNRKILIIAVFAILVIINAVQFYMSNKSEERHKAMLESKEMDLVYTYAKLDSISGELNNKILEIKRLGGDIDSLMKIKEQLELEKNELRLSRNLAQTRYNDIKDKIEGYEFLLKRKDQDIAKLKEVNAALLSENTQLKDERNEMTAQLRSMEETTTQLAEKVSIAGALRAENIRFVATRKGKARDGNEFRVNQIEELQILFNLADNKVAELGSKVILLRLIEPEGQTYVNTAQGGGTFTFNGEETYFTLSKEILFDNSQQEVVFDFQRGSEYKKGQHRVELFSGGVKIGQGSFIVK